MTCDSCKSEVRSFDGVNITRENDTPLSLCSKCYNETIAKSCGFDFTHISFEPVTFADKNGEKHTFNFSTRLFGDNVSIEALEIKEFNTPKGYVFAVHGKAEEDTFSLFEKLIKRIKRCLEINHIETGKLTRYRITNDDIVRGHISWDDETDGELPLLVIDGKEIPWHEFGKMLMTYEGFNFRLDIFDRVEEK